MKRYSKIIALSAFAAFGSLFLLPAPAVAQDNQMSDDECTALLLTVGGMSVVCGASLNPWLCASAYAGWITLNEGGCL